MRRRLERLLPLVVLLGFGATAVLVNALLTDAQESGVEALEDAIASEVSAIAGNQNQRIIAQLSAIEDAAASATPELTLGSEADLALLERAIIDPDREAGLYLLDADATVTQGVLFTGDPVGTRFAWAGFEGLPVERSEDGGMVLPVAPEGLTTGRPAIAYVVPITDAATGAVRGAVVIEQVVAPDSDFNQEVGTLQRGETGDYLVFDRFGTVIASNDASLVAERLDDERMVEGRVGVHRFDDRVVALADVPRAGWRVAFRQDADEFEGDLARPVESVGQILVLVLLAGGFLVTVLLERRLRAARAEQARLRQLGEAQQELISIVSHELRTPVAGVLGFLETTLDHWDAMDDVERRRAVGRAATNARRLQAMTRDVLDTQVVESGRLVHVLQPVDLRDEVRIAVEAARELDAERTIELELPADPVWVSADADRVQQVLANLLDNARKNSPAVEPVEVTLQRVDGEAALSVHDHGAGIDREAVERIFDKFVRGRDDGVSGTGLGLYIARQIIDAHGGRIWAESEGHGATFRVTLPAISDPGAPPG